LLEFHWHDWRRDKFIGGAYSYIPVNGLEFVKQLAAAVENTLFFAGEATAGDAQPGTVHGALSSGLRAAREFRRDSN
jgi:monoamine oxidase